VQVGDDTTEYESAFVVADFAGGFGRAPEPPDRLLPVALGAKERGGF
jgi:hypothetical protein